MRWSEEELARYRRRFDDIKEDTSEADFQAKVIALAKQHGWLLYHTYDSRRSQPGFPDLVLCGRSGVVFVEIKTSTGKLTRDQAIWVEMLKYAGQEVAIWRPEDWPTIEARLAQG